ncbi:hypothetical protein COT79_03170 [Candidatus Berkelbacteria bacterium CG10_big_fil_rev_8_21_14_0_10_43_14]|uniref:Transcobalamin-like C-terminal domain-containing protein n=1 Tax=Candidatus Berkelbacteria bacterium CG10_big_fil_rev_8_21_14_0_10_43_14 TaxID=1974515 RepID=A0A2M6R845_9BACT|nr:MAG: hypothetical protein COT79_03170 [Candidatus Berkelbacteria bacterium CG10_big_fil_rev_8_21_14_0_10_43_14]
MPQDSKRSPFVSVIIVLIAIGMIAMYSSFLTGSSSSQPTQDQSQVQPTQQNISYQGKDGVDAMTLLKETHSVDASDQGFVNAIDGVKPAEKQFWSLYVNGKPSDLGAKDTITKSTDSIEWKLDSF